MNILYKASATSIGGRDGTVRSSDGILDLQLALPPGLGGPGGKTNPEQLFAATYAACFHGALKRAAAEHKVSVKDSTVTADIGIGPNDKGGFGLDVDLLVTLPNATEEEAKKVVEAAHQICPYSNATRGNIDVRLAVKAGEKEPVAVS
jgi:osmotically inducible protein OsmC